MANLAFKFKQNIVKPSTNFDIHDQNNHKIQRFVFRDGLSFEEGSVDKITKTCRTKELVGNDMFLYNTAPILTFRAYYHENLGDGDKSTTRFRKCKLYYSLENDEIKVYEPAQLNSGLPQGVIVKKGKYRKPEGGFYTIDDLNIGEDIMLNGREYRLINCDDFTRRFLTETGYRVRPPEPDICDPITQDREEANKLRSYRKPYVKDYKYAPFFKYHPKKLRFYARYGGDKNLFEFTRNVTLYYDLSDGAITLVESPCQTEIIGSHHIVLRPTLVPKRPDHSLPHGEMCNPTILNLGHDVKNVLIGGKYFKVHNANAYMVDSNPLEGRKKHVDYIKDTDIDIGVPLEIFGYRVFPYDCDEFTKQYYLSTYNKELTPIPLPTVDIPRSHKLVYQHENIGSTDQTIRTNDPFDPFVNKRVAIQFFKDHCSKYGYDVRELKFLAHILSEDPIEKMRRYVVCFTMEDDTMQIRELWFNDHQKERTMEHACLKRIRVAKPQSSLENAGPCFYQPLDMFVGNVICVRGKAYELLEADEYTYNYMEKYSNMFPHSNVRKILLEFKDWITFKSGGLKARFEAADPEKTGYITYEDFKEALYAEMPEDNLKCYPEHAMRTVGRHYAEIDYIGLRFEDLAREVQTELYRKKFYDFKDVDLAFKIHDEEKTGFLDPDRVYYIMRTASLPLSRDLIKAFVYKFPKIKNKIQYSCFVEALDWINHPAELSTAEPQVVQINWERIEEERNLNKIKYNCFMMDVLSS